VFEQRADLVHGPAVQNGERSMAGAGQGHHLAPSVHFAAVAHDQAARFQLAEQPAGVTGVQGEPRPKVGNPGALALGEFKEHPRFAQRVLGVGRSLVEDAYHPGVQTVEGADSRHSIGQLVR
jgi:hypothetical protein